MSTLTFEELHEVFEYGKVWSGGYEHYWYEYAWSILVRQGAAAYNNQREYYEAWLRAVSLVRVYKEFCQIDFDESYDNDFERFVEDVIPEVAVGQLLDGLLSKDEIFDDVNDALIFILDYMKYDVFGVIAKEIDYAEAFALMHCTCDTSYFDEEKEITCVSDYKKEVDNVIGDVLLDSDYEPRSDAFIYVASLMTL